MGQVSSKLRRATGSYFWFCPGCQAMHPLPDGWAFNKDLDRPTFSPSFLHWWGLKVRCHYIVTDGQVQYCSDSSHPLAGQTIPMPDLPPEHRDGPIHMLPRQAGA